MGCASSKAVHGAVVAESPAKSKGKRERERERERER
jgi:hypothetical protein